ncbi:hypothetical protein CL656_06160 [bacterium]|nr:hypothetical protein [bacterium]|tara:strand:- start:178 stop:1047 length:870 start_codon:yes stop_codon:yes gene_type:complete
MTYFKLINNDKIQKFIQIMKTIKLFNDYISFIFNEDKLYIQGMDSSHICLYELNINNSWFDEYDYNGNDSKIIMSCYSSIINKILVLCKNNQGIVLSLDDENYEKINIDIFDISLKQLETNNNENINEKSFEINCIDLESELLTPDDMDYDIDLYISSKDLSNSFGEMVTFGDEIEMFCYSNLLKLKTTSSENIMTQKISFDQLFKYEVIEDYKAYNKFQLNYLNNITSLHKVFPKIKLSIQNDTPLCIYFEDINDKEQTDLYVRFYLAPKVDVSEYENIEQEFLSMIK